MQTRAQLAISPRHYPRLIFLTASLRLAHCRVYTYTHESNYPALRARAAITRDNAGAGASELLVTQVRRAKLLRACMRAYIYGGLKWRRGGFFLLSLSLSFDAMTR